MNIFRGFFYVPDQLSWRRRRHPRKNSAAEKLSQTESGVLEGHQWWLKYELPSSNTSDTCGYRQHFLGTSVVEVKCIPTWAGLSVMLFSPKVPQHFLWWVVIYKWYSYGNPIELNVLIDSKIRIYGKCSNYCSLVALCSIAEDFCNKLPRWTLQC